MPGYSAGISVSVFKNVKMYLFYPELLIFSTYDKNYMDELAETTVGHKKYLKTS